MNSVVAEDPLREDSTLAPGRRENDDWDSALQHGDENLPAPAVASVAVGEAAMHDFNSGSEGNGACVLSRLPMKYEPSQEAFSAATAAAAAAATGGSLGGAAAGESSVLKKRVSATVQQSSSSPTIGQGAIETSTILRRRLRLPRRVGCLDVRTAR